MQVPEKSEVSYSYGEATPEYGNIAIVIKTIKHVSPRVMNFMLAKIARPTIERLKQYKDVEAPVDRRLSLDKVEACM